MFPSTVAGVRGRRTRARIAWHTFLPRLEYRSRWHRVRLYGHYTCPLPGPLESVWPCARRSRRKTFSRPSVLSRSRAPTYVDETNFFFPASTRGEATNDRGGGGGERDDDNILRPCVSRRSELPGRAHRSRVLATRSPGMRPKVRRRRRRGIGIRGDEGRRSKTIGENPSCACVCVDSVVFRANGSTDGRIIYCATKTRSVTMVAPISPMRYCSPQNARPKVYGGGDNKRRTADGELIIAARTERERNGDGESSFRACSCTDRSPVYRLRCAFVRIPIVCHFLPPRGKRATSPPLRRTRTILLSGQKFSVLRPHGFAPVYALVEKTRRRTRDRRNYRTLRRGRNQKYVPLANFWLELVWGHVIIGNIR